MSINECKHNWIGGRCMLCGKECRHEWVDSTEMETMSYTVAASYESGNEYGPYSEVEYQRTKLVSYCSKCGDEK